MKIVKKELAKDFALLILTGFLISTLSQVQRFGSDLILKFDVFGSIFSEP
ncbi:MAG: hypothetical protein ACQEW9_17185 [Bacteroidota bacterium]